MSKTIGIRVDAKLDTLIENISESMNLKKSQIIKKAFIEWLRTREGIQGQNMMLVDSVLIATLFKKISIDEIKDIADTMSSHIASLIRIRQIENNRQEETVTEFLDNFSRLISNQNFGWFTKINYNLDDDIISIYGFHILNTDYSQYAVELLSHVLRKLYGYTLLNEQVTMTDNSFILKLQK